MELAKIIFNIVILISFAGVLIAASDPEVDIGNAVCSVVDIVRTIMGAVMLILIVMAAIIYAAGQVMGAETRARANVWATSMFLGAIIGGLIYLVVPVFIDAMMGGGGVLNCCNGSTVDVNCLKTT